MDKLTAIKIKHPNGQYSDPILLSVLADNVRYDDTRGLKDVIQYLDTRIGNIIAAPSGSTDLDVQVIDARTGADTDSSGNAITHATAGDAIRAQYLKSLDTVLVKETQPTEKENKLWIDKSTSGDDEVQILTIDDLDIIAPIYSENSIYAAGDYVVYDGGLYKCNADIETAEAWTIAHWASTNVSEKLIDIDETLTAEGMAAEAKVTGDAISDLKENLSQLNSSLYDGIYNGYKSLLLKWENGWVNSSGLYDPNDNRYLIEGKSTSEATTIVNNSESTIYVIYFSAYADLTNFTYDSFVTVSKNKTIAVNKTKAYFLIESTATIKAGLYGVQLRNASNISYLSKNEIDNREQHKQNIFFAYCADIFWSISGNDCSLSVNSNIRVRFDTTGTSVDTTPEQLISIAQASSAGVTVANGIITGKHFAVVFDFGTNQIKIVDPVSSETYINTAILFYWFWGALGGFLVDNKTALTVTNMEDSIADYFVTEAQTCRDELIANCGEKAFVIAFTTDNHYGVSNGMNFPTTVKTIKKVNDMYQFDIIVDGGDLINGDKPKADAINLLTGAVNDLIEIGRPVYTLLGNHDDDSYTSTAQPLFSKAELYAMMYRHSGFDLDYIAEDSQYGYKDFDQYGLRIIFLDAIYGANGHSTASWGYSDTELAWFTSDALNTTNQVVIFSHMAFTADYIAYKANIKNGVAMRTAVENFIANGGVVVGLFHGHNHWDYIGQYSQTNGFYEVSTGCGRIISGPTISYAHPEGAVMPERTVNTVTQELWDIIVIKPESRTVNMIRYGAGNNRSFSY